MSHERRIATRSTVQVRLKNGIEIPVIAAGMWQIPDDVAERVVREAIEVGYRHIDTAQAGFSMPYGLVYAKEPTAAAASANPCYHALFRMIFTSPKS